MRAAIFNPHMLPMGGSERVTLAMINALSSLGWQVDLYSVNEFRPGDLAAGFGVDVRVSCQVRTTRIPTLFRKLDDIRRGGVYLNLLRRYLEKRIEECDIFIDMMPFMTYGAIYPRLPDLAYWNLPPDLRPITSKYSIFGEVYLLPIRRLLPGLSKRWRRVKMHVANSQFTRSAVIKELGSELRSAVIYPPVDIDLWSVHPSEGSRSGIASLARFDQWKRQDLQLLIMKGLRTHLKMIGRAVRKDEVTYLGALEQMARKIGHADIYVNLPQPQVKKLLGSSRVFIHTASAEPFGITIVEAIAAGCVPIVRESGATSEIVPFEELRFQTIEQARDKILRALAGQYDHLLVKLKAHIQQFHERTFKREITRKALELLEA